MYTLCQVPAAEASEPGTAVIASALTSGISSTAPSYCGAASGFSFRNKCDLMLAALIFLAVVMALKEFGRG